MMKKRKKKNRTVESGVDSVAAAEEPPHERGADSAGGVHYADRLL